MSVRVRTGKVLRVIAKLPKFEMPLTMDANASASNIPHWPVYGEATYSDCGLYRYGLLRRWDTTLPVMVFIMLNPSTAGHDTDDPTIVRCMDFAMHHDCGGILVVNLFAYRATDPKDLWAAWPGKSIVGAENRQVLYRVIAAAHARGWPICAGWGAVKNDHALYVIQDVLSMRAKVGAELQCLGYTKAGMPRHPLYLSSTEFLRPWPPAGYMLKHFTALTVEEVKEEGYSIAEIYQG